MDTIRDCDFVKVALRIKSAEAQANGVEVISRNPSVLLVPEKQLTYTFDHIFDQDVNQQQIYSNLVEPLVQKVFLGYNATVFAYGQTGTGKTYTIGSNPSDNGKEDAGLITRVLEDILSQKNRKNTEISVSFIEIYNEKVYDLLGTNNKRALQVKGFKVTGVTKHLVTNVLDALDFLMGGGNNRHTGETKQNLKSSRSHAIFSVYCKVQHLHHNTDAKLHLVDLAGSESIKRTGNEGNLLHEGININKGLLCVGRVINALSNNDLHVPYRESTITTILQDSLNKKNFITLIACICASAEDLTETVQTLEFSQSAKRLRSRPELNSNVNVPRFAASTPLRRNTHVRGTLRRNPRRTASTVRTADEIPAALSPILRRCIEEVEERIIGHLTSIISSSQIQSQPISRASLQREIKSIVSSNIMVDPEGHTFRNALNLVGDSSACGSDGHLCNAPPNSPTDCAVDGENGEQVMFKVPQVPPKRSGRVLKKSNVQSRRSARLQIKDKENIPKDESESLKVHEISPRRLALKTDHREAILQILNNGTMSDIMKLQTIGHKSAELICDFRTLRGKFANLEALRKVPLRGHGYERFMDANFLNID